MVTHYLHLHHPTCLQSLTEPPITAVHFAITITFHYKRTPSSSPQLSTIPDSDSPQDTQQNNAHDNVILPVSSDRFCKSPDLALENRPISAIACTRSLRSLSCFAAYSQSLYQSQIIAIAFANCDIISVAFATCKIFAIAFANRRRTCL